MPFSSIVSDLSRPSPIRRERTPRFRDLNAGKANFSAAYARPDPRAYAAVLGALDYRIPTEALPVFRRVIASCRDKLERAQLRVADVGCSFGVNAALLKHDVTLRSFFARYRTTPLKGAPSRGLVRADREFFAETLDDDALSFIGIDISAAALDYAERVGLLDDGVSENLETGSPSPEAQALLCDVDLIISTGCVGYVSERTFEHMLDCQGGGKPWIASFVLRMFPYEGIADSLSARGYVTEKLQGQFFAQRRVADDAEWHHMLDALRRRRLAPTEAENAGIFQAEFFLSRPVEDAQRRPLARLIARNG